MKSINSKLAVFGIALALSAGMAFAQGEGQESMPMHHGMHGDFMGGHGLGLPLHQLCLPPYWKRSDSAWRSWSLALPRAAPTP